MRKIAIIGGIGTALNIASQIVDGFEATNSSDRIIGFVVDNLTKEDRILDLPVLGNLDDIRNGRLLLEDLYFIYSLYRLDVMPERIAIYQSLNIPIDRMYSYIHPSAYVSKNSVIGCGTIILSNSTIQDSVKIGNNNIINSNVVIEHDTHILDNNFIAAGAVIGANAMLSKTFVGMNSSIREHVRLDNCVVGMQSCVLNDFKDVTLYGVPAKADLQ